MCTVPVARRFCRESYNDAAEVYHRLKRLGMDLVTVTDHDSIDAVESLRRYPDFFLSEEVTCVLPSGAEAHVGVYDLNERQHIEIQRRRDDLFALVAYLKEQNLFFSVNHLFSGLTGKRVREDYLWFDALFPAYETLNGAMMASVNRRAGEIAGLLGKAPLGGSDAHAMHSVGRAWTQVPGAATKVEFFAGLRAGRGRVSGAAGSWWLLTRDVLSICGNLIAEKPWTLLLLPLLAGVPVVTLVSCFKDASFARKWFDAVGPAAPAAGSSVPACAEAAV
jgi:predicted metal-dependent phosphoesterase TrpH